LLSKHSKLVNTTSRHTDADGVRFGPVDVLSASGVRERPAGSRSADAIGAGILAPPRGEAATSPAPSFSGGASVDLSGVPLGGGRPP